MLVLTIWPEWAWAIFSPLEKDAENRTWAPSPKRLPPGSDLLIHAGKHPGGRPGDAAWMRTLNDVWGVAGRAAWLGSYVMNGLTFKQADPDALDGYRYARLDRDTMTTSAILGVVRVLRFGPYGSPWSAPGQTQWVLEDPRPFLEPVPCPGRQGLWFPPPPVMSLVREQLAILPPSPDGAPLAL